MARMTVAGVAVYALGYAIFATTRRIQFSGTGMANRSLPRPRWASR
jgi:hypothetical protein